jgi:uncharacterized protein
MKLLRLIVVTLIAIAVAGIAGVTVFQRSLEYLPHTEVVAPTQIGVSVQRIRTIDGETLIAWYLPAPKGAPIFLFFDGNGGAPEFWTARWKAIADGGAGFLAVYYRGYSGSTGHPTEAGLHEDAREGYDWLKAHGYKPSDIVIEGFSLGTGVAVRLATEREARALILEAPFASAADAGQERFPFLPVHLLMWDQFKSRDYIGKVHMPLFVAHGDADSVVPYKEGQALFALANEPKEFVTMPGSNHTTMVDDGLFPHIWAFLAKHPGQ